ncbi:MAG: exodeoxyribonuclease VII small subunit [Chloroflexota bacterium]
MSAEKKVEKLNYEQAFEELEKVVAELEEGDQPLAKALALFEHGQALAQRCAELLNEAELKVEQLTQEGELEDFNG